MTTVWRPSYKLARALNMEKCDRRGSSMTMSISKTNSSSKKKGFTSWWNSQSADMLILSFSRSRNYSGATYWWMLQLRRPRIANISFRATYDCNMGSDVLRCMLLDTALPSVLVIASHLFRQKSGFISEKLIGISDIDDVRNGLLLFKPLKHAFDHIQISFIYDQSSKDFRLKIFDHSVQPQRLFEKLDNKQRARLLQSQALPKNWRSRGPRLAPGTVYDIQTTFGDLEGRALRFMSVERPYKRSLKLQARLARQLAIEKHWIRPGEDNFLDFWAEGMSLAGKMKFFFANED